MRFFLSLILTLMCFSSIEAHSKLTIDEFFNVTHFQSINLSPNGRYLLVASEHPAWDSNSYEQSLWLYETSGRRKQLITNQLFASYIPKWSPSGDYFVYLMKDKFDSTNDRHRVIRSVNSSVKNEQHIYLYNIASDEIIPVGIGYEKPSALTWSDVDSSLYFAAASSESTEDVDREYEDEWKDVIEYRRRKPNDGSIIYHIDISRKNRRVTSKIHQITHLNFIVSDLLYTLSEHKIICSSFSNIIENSHDLEIYSIDLLNPSSVKQLTNNDEFEMNLRLSKDGKHLFFRTASSLTGKTTSNKTQIRLKSIDLTNGQIDEWGKGFQGNVNDYAIRPEGGVFILGQLGTNTNVYVQQSSSKYLTLQRGWNGTYRAISTSSSKRYFSVAFLHSAFERPEEVYLIDHIDELSSAKRITNENQFLTKKHLPRSKVYTWVNSDDHRMVEGILHYPPDKFEQKNLPLLVLIHGGSAAASLNLFPPIWYMFPHLAAVNGWLVLEPNYRGSTGYGDQFVSEIYSTFLSRPGRDILDGVDRLVQDGIADPTRLNVGGYSYGGYLTNWLITQTTRFNAAFSGAGPLDHVSFWGTTNIPIYANTLIGGFPWEIPDIYAKESIIYHLDNVHTPTLIFTGANDVAIPADQSFILERGLKYLGIPSKLLIFPNEGHDLLNNPWHSKIQIREQLKWLERYGHVSWFKMTG
ncbi:unnamed protein product [Rotaria socialis]|uniref:Peptidase S9 prolyl oligopeptidase catalytic domain-containing protein n=1 Tax=Rotaria socialis TaxID=392032 RepID=A0A821UE77_9BILA|nr:unnamed protein product [Rotaria socialis]CAF4888387.1 unnamed protein product [Rotaria socialis]